MQLNREKIIELFEEQEQSPQAINRTGTIFDTRSVGAAYILEYEGDSAGWTLSSKQILTLLKYKKNSIVFLDAIKEELFVVFDDNKLFYDFIKLQPNPYKISKCYLKKNGYEISYESYDDYLVRP